MAKEPKALPGHNEAREADLLALMAEFRPALDKVEEAKAVVKKAEKDYAVVRNKAEVLGFALATLDKALKLERQPSNRKLQQAQADEEFFVFKTLGLPVAAVQGTMDFGSDEARDEKYWGDQGFQAGIRGDAATPPDGMPPHLHQTWLTRRADGAAYTAWGKSEAGGRPDRLNTGAAPEPKAPDPAATVSTIDEARAAKALAEASTDGKTPKGKPTGAAAKDPLLA